MRSPSERERPSRWAERSVAGFVAVILCLDALLAVARPSPETAETLRLLLVGGACLTVPLAAVLAVVSRPIHAVWGLLAVPLVAVYAVSGLLLPWNQVAFAVGGLALDAVRTVPLLGDPLATVLFGGTELSERSLQLAFRYHYAVVGVGIAGLSAVLGRRLLARGTAAESAA